MRPSISWIGSRRTSLTIEDPVEYVFSDIKQTKVNEKAGITFAAALKISPCCCAVSPIVRSSKCGVSYAHTRREVMNGNT